MFNRRLIYSSAIIYSLLAIYAAYFKYFPVIISPLISNLLIMGTISLILGILILNSFWLRSNFELYIILPQYLLFAFITRALPILRFTYQPLSDPYYYFIATLNIANHGTLEPVLSWWYEQVLQQLTWPNLHLIGSFLMSTTGVQSIDLLRYIGPAVGVIFFLGVFIFAKEITSNNAVALIAGLFASIGDTVLFYQSEYHPQGWAFAYFVFLVYLFVRCGMKPNSSNGLMLIISSIAFGLSHHFSNVLIILFIVIYVSLYLPLKAFLLKIFNPNWKLKAHMKLSCITILILIIAIFNHIFTYPNFIKTLKFSLEAEEVMPSGSLIAVGTAIPLEATVLNSVKYILLFLALISIIYIIYTLDFKEFICSVALLTIVLLGIVGTFISFIPVDRLLGFYIPFASVFAALTLYRIYTVWFQKCDIRIRKFFVLIVSLLILLAGPLNFFAPGLILHDSPRDSYYWHSNDFSAFASFGVPGCWIKVHVSNESSFSSYPGTYMIAYFYGGIPLANTQNGSYLIYTIKEKIPETVAEGQVYSSGRFGIGIASF
jgi:hypothetical protein